MPRSRSMQIKVAGSAQVLEARLSETSPHSDLAIVAPPHPVHGGSIDSPVVRTIESAFQSLSIDTLAFNFRGTGTSSGDVSAELSHAALDHWAVERSLDRARVVWLSGYSFGGSAALEAAIELGVEHVLIVAPAIALIDPALLKRYVGRLFVAVGSEDDYAPIDELRALLGGAAQAYLEVLPGADHFFSGRQLIELRPRVIELLQSEAVTRA